MKPTHLITLSSLVTELNENLLSGLDQSKELELIKNWNEKLKHLVTLAIFVPCDANGVPLEKPKGKNPKRSIWEPYNEAQKSVIFEGWEVYSSIEVRNKNDDRLNFRNGHVFYDIHDGDGGYIGNYLPDTPTLEALAAATTENPLKLK